MDNPLEKQEKAEQRLTFARRNDLKKILRQLDKDSAEAIELLSTVMKDTEQDTKIRVQAAQYLIDKRIQVSESVSRDQLARTMAEAKILFEERKALPREKDVTEDDTPPKVTFNPEVVQDISKLKSL